MRSSTQQKKNNKKGFSVVQPIDTNPYINRHANVQENCVILYDTNPSDYTNLSQTEIHEDAPLLVHRGFVEYCDISLDLYFTIDKLEKNHGEQEIDCRIQHPSFFGFGDGTHFSEQQQKTVKLKDYVEYQREISKNSPRLKVLKQKFGLHGKYEDFILFGVNIDMKKELWKEELHELKHKCTEEYTWLNRQDLLSYMTQDIPGVTLPQLYLKVKGTWTGGHQENLGVRSVNINFGPGSSEWVSLSYDQVDEFRQYTKKKYNTDVIKDTGYWYADYHELEEAGFKPQYCIQKPGDLVILAPSTLHWVRSIDEFHSVQVAWNFVKRSVLDFQEIFKRYNINQEIKFEVVIPMKNWLLHTISHNFEWLTTLSNKNITFEIKNYIKNQLTDELKFRDQIIQKLQVQQIDYSYSPKILQCDRQECRQEIFMHYGKCHYQHPKKQAHANILCMKCCLEHVNQLKCYKINISYRYRVDQLKKFLNTLDRIIDDKLGSELTFREGICHGNDYIGETIHDISFDSLHQYQQLKNQNFMKIKEQLSIQERCESESQQKKYLMEIEQLKQQQELQESLEQEQLKYIQDQENLKYIQEQERLKQQQKIQLPKIQVLDEHQDEPHIIQEEQNPEFACTEDVVMEEMNGNGRKKSRPFKKQDEKIFEVQESKKASTRSGRNQMIINSDEENAIQIQKDNHQVIISQEEQLSILEVQTLTETDSKKGGQRKGRPNAKGKASSIQSRQGSDINEESKECQPKKKRLNLLYESTEQQINQQKIVKEKSIKDRLFDNGDENEDYVKIHKKNKKETKNSVNLVASQSPMSSTHTSKGFPTQINEPTLNLLHVKIENQEHNN